MKIVTQLSLFDDMELGDLEKLTLVMENLPDEELLKALNKRREKGGAGYTNESLWIAFIAKFVFQHPTIETLIRELRRNSQLRKICGFEPWTDSKGATHLVPGSSTFSRFISRLMEYENEMKKIIQALIRTMYELIPDFGETCAIDGKIIKTYASSFKKEKSKDRRADNDASYTAKTYTSADGKTTTPNFFYGYRLHLLCDCKYELPVAYTVTPANEGEIPVAKSFLFQNEFPYFKRMKYFLGDRGYDDTDLIERLEEKDITVLIPNRYTWQNETTRQYLETDLIYDQEGNVYYVDDAGKEHLLRYAGYDRYTDSLRYTFKYKGSNNKVFRIKREENLRIFPKISRSSKKYKRLYKQRTAVERINGRLDRDFMFENHTIRGLSKMTLYVNMSFMISLGFAKGKILEKDVSNLASWVA
jgi:transposase